MDIPFAHQIGISIHRTDLLFTRYATKRLSSVGIAPEQNLVILLLAERSPQTQKELGLSLNKDKTNMTRLLAALERKGLARRTNPLGDRRSLVVTLTPAGEKVAKLTAPIAAGFQQLLTRGISATELDGFTRTLDAMNANLSASMFATSKEDQ